MFVLILLAALGAAFTLAILAAILWALTRAPDRVQVATLCLLLCNVGYLYFCARLYEQDGAPRVIALALGAYMLVLHGVTAMLAIGLQRWAWQAAVVGFGVHIAAPFIGWGLGLLGSRNDAIAGAAWVLIGAVGLWAALHPGTRTRAAAASSATAAAAR